VGGNSAPQEGTKGKGKQTGSIGGPNGEKNQTDKAMGGRLTQIKNRKKSKKKENKKREKRKKREENVHVANKAWAVGSPGTMTKLNQRML